MCAHPSLDSCTESQAITKEMWVRWDGLTERAAPQPIQPASASTAVPVSVPSGYDSDTVEYDLEQFMDTDSENLSARDVVTTNNTNTLPVDMQELIRQVTPVAWLENPLPSPQHVLITDN